MEEERVIPQFVPYWGEEERARVLDVLGSDYLNEHRTVREFEREFASFVGARHCVTVTSGTIALYCAACAAGWRGKKVSVPSHDGIFAFNALTACGAEPLVCDVDGRGLLAPAAADGEVGRVVVHANGRISAGVPEVEDCAQATGHHTQGRVSTYSFASTKHITTAGQGGAVCCDDPDTFDALARIKDHGRNDRQSLRPMSDAFDRWGMNFKFTEIQAAFGLAQLRSLPRRQARFVEILSIYKDGLAGAVEFDGEDPGWYADVFVDDPEAVVGRLKKKGVLCRRYPRPLHQQGVAQGRLAAGGFAGAEARHARGMYLPSSTNLSDEDAKRVAREVRDAAGRL